MDAIAKAQNALFEKQYSTQSSKTMYKLQQIGTVQFVATCLFWTYVLSALVFLTILILKKGSWAFKVAFLVLVIAYPFAIYTVEIFLMKTVTFLLQSIVGEVFTRPDTEFGVDYSYLFTFS